MVLVSVRSLPGIFFPPLGSRAGLVAPAPILHPLPARPPVPRTGKPRPAAAPSGWLAVIDLVGERSRFPAQAPGADRFA